ncbi:dimethylargininase [uncultured Demequina sp.]|uniref:dimethylargininase n=1 Tax=uncultured Demequina sp. TaxID=693499 RepID=UPI0025D993BD|nr:dimethylargininase [uncultured Demequina sp.]
MTVPAPSAAPARVATPLSVLMCRPTYFTVAYAINPWMDPSRPTDTALAIAQWEDLVATYRSLGFGVELLEPLPGLPDMVFAANGGLVVAGRAYTASFAHEERRPEAAAHAAWFAAAGLEVVEATEVNEGEGDFLAIGDAILAGTGFRASRGSHEELARVFDREIVPLTLVREDYYHLDTAIAVLDARPGSEQIAYLPSAFDGAGLAELRRRYPQAIEASEEDAALFALNVVSDGRHVVTAAGATRFHAQLAADGFVPVSVDLSELRAGGGGVKCCTLEVRLPRAAAEAVA